MLFFAKNIQFLRKKSGITQAEMPKYIEVTRTTWSNYENNVSEPDLAKLSAIAKLFGVTTDQLLSFDLTEDINSKNNFSSPYKEGQVLLSENPPIEPQRNQDLNNEILIKLSELAENMELLKKGLL